MANESKGLVNILQEFSVPLLAGVGVALLSANLAPGWYEHSLHWQPFGEVAVFGHSLTLHFLVNDIFMVFFFGIAAKEITESCLPGGSLNPIRKAITPLVATLGGVVGPIGVFFLGLWLCFAFGVYDAGLDDFASLARGWGIPTATDIALAWLVARAVYGRGHPAVAFLLLLAVADDAIGLVIIAAFYGDPALPFAPAYLLLVLAGMALALGMRWAGVRRWVPYVALAGPLSWCGLMLAHLHPALALALIVPFMPGPETDTGLFVEEDEFDVSLHDGELPLGAHSPLVHSPLHLFEHNLKLFVDFGLFFFAFCNAGVQFASIGPLTWLILGALIVGKTLGVSASCWLAGRLGFALPAGMDSKDLAVAGFIAAIGLTVALFVADAAYVEPALRGQAKMGALFSGLIGLAALAIGRALGLNPGKSLRADSEWPSDAPGPPPPGPSEASSDQRVSR